jgi:ATP-dependent RNA helicase DDX27
MTRKQKRRKLALEADKELGDTKNLNAAIRSAKKLNQPQKIGMLETRSSSRTKKGIGKKLRGRFETEVDRNAKKAKTRGVGQRPRKSTAIGSGKSAR